MGGRGAIAHTAESGQDFSCVGMIPIAESSPECPRSGGPTAAAQDAMFAVEIDLGVAGIGIGLEVGVAIEPGVCPFPHIAEHIQTADGTEATRVGIDGGGVADPMAAITSIWGGPTVAPGIGQARGSFGFPAGGFFPFGFGGEAFAQKFGVGGGFVPTDSADGMIGVVGGG